MTRADTVEKALDALTTLRICIRKLDPHWGRDTLDELSDLDEMLADVLNWTEVEP